jgi:catechol 2,3-dioxygenase-like lactoylglutathione lyase family enzyme
MQNIERVSAVTFAVRDMGRSVDFYEKAGFEVCYGGRDATFSTLKAGDAFVNLVAMPDYEPFWWGRAIFRVRSADAHHQMLRERGLKTPPPQNASWGERFFHIADPDGHELSFAELLPPSM